MKITFESTVSIHSEEYNELTLYFSDDISSKKVLAIKEMIPKNYLHNNKELIKRIVDKMFYELKNKVMEEFESINKEA